jgi:hypothetical protein
LSPWKKSGTIPRSTSLPVRLRKYGPTREKAPSDDQCDVVSSVLAGALEDQRREPVVVLERGLPVGDGADDDRVAVSVAHPPERREDDVHVELQRPAPVVEEAVKALRVRRLRHPVADLRRIAQPARVLE